MSTVDSNAATTIASDRAGEGPPGILVGGAFQHRALDSRTARLAAQLAAPFTVVGYDRSLSTTVLLTVEETLRALGRAPGVALGPPW